MSAKFRVPLKVPSILEVNVTEIVQEPFGATLLLQVLVWEKWPDVEMLVMASAVEPVFVSTTFLEGGGHRILGMLELSLHEKLRVAGISCTVPFVRVSVAVLNFVGSVIEAAFTSTLVFAGSVAGPLKADTPGVAFVAGVVLLGFIIPHPGVQSDPF